MYLPLTSTAVRGYCKSFSLLQSELLSQKIDPRLTVEIFEYIKEGLPNVLEMKRLLKITVNEMFGKKDLPAINNRRFYPTTDIVHSHMVKEHQKQR